MIRYVSLSFLFLAFVQLGCAGGDSSPSPEKAVVKNTAELLELLPSLEREAFENWSHALLKKCDVGEIFLLPQPANLQHGIDLTILKRQTGGSPVLTSPGSAAFAILGPPQEHFGTSLTHHTIMTVQNGRKTKLELTAELSNGICQLSVNGMPVERVELAGSVPVIAHHDFTKYMKYNAQLAKWEPIRFAFKGKPVKSSGGWLALSTDFAIASAAALLPARFNDQLAPKFISDRLGLKGALEAQQYFPPSWDARRWHTIELRGEGENAGAEPFAGGIQHPSLFFHYAFEGETPSLAGSLVARASQAKPLLAGGKNVIELRWHFGNGVNVTQILSIEGSVARGGYSAVQSSSGLPQVTVTHPSAAGHCLASRLSGARELSAWSPAWPYFEHVAAPCQPLGAAETGFMHLLKSDKSFRTLFHELLARLALSEKTNFSGWEHFFKGLASAAHASGVNPGLALDPELRLKLAIHAATEYESFVKLAGELGQAGAMKDLGAELARLSMMFALKGQPAIDAGVKKQIIVSADRSRVALRSSFARLVEEWGAEPKNLKLRDKFKAIAAAPASRFSDLELVRSELRSLGMGDVADYRIGSFYQHDPIPFDSVETWKSSLRSVRRYLAAEAERTAGQLDESGTSSHYYAKMSVARLAFENMWTEFSFELLEKYARMARFVKNCGVFPDTSRRVQCAGANLGASKGAMMAPGHRERLGTFVDVYEASLAAMPANDDTQARIAAAFFGSIWGLCTNEAYVSKAQKLNVLIGRHAANPSLSKNHDFKILLELTVANCY
ncbi:MAG TPA: hypothetical protein VFV50_13340 [Bdellovibrionales bacterium]|nr:hypothetical protein [Bdellovibrionales bacterium]